MLDSSAAIEIALDTVEGRALRGLWCVDERVVSVAWYDLEGRRVTMPHHGVYIKAETLQNGQQRRRKVMM